MKLRLRAGAKSRIGRRFFRPVLSLSDGGRDRAYTSPMTRNALVFVALFMGAAGCGSSSGAGGGANPGPLDHDAGLGADGSLGALPGDDAAGPLPGDDAASPGPDAAPRGDGSPGTGSDGGLTGPTGRPYPDTSASIAILTDQLPS